MRARPAHGSPGSPLPAQPSQIKPSICWRNSFQGPLGRRAGPGPHPAVPSGSGSPPSLAPPPPAVAEAAGGRRAGAHVRVAEARKPGGPGRWTHQRPRGVGSARLARGHSRCARRVENDSASLGSVFTAGPHEGPTKFPVTPQTSRAGRGLLQPGPGGGGQRGRGAGGGARRVPWPPRASPTSFRLARSSARGQKAPPAQGVGVGVGERVASGPQRNLAFPKSRGSADPEGLGAAVASLPGPDSPAAAAVARTPGCSALERQQLGSPAGASGAAPRRPEPEPRARAPAPPFAPFPVRRRGRSSSRGRPRSSALAGTRGAPSPVPASLRRWRPRPPPQAPAPSSRLLPLRLPLPSGESSKARQRPTPPPQTLGRSSRPPRPPQQPRPLGSGDRPGPA